MKLTFFFQPVTDLAEAIGFYRDQLGFEEAWREADDTVSFWVPGRFAQIMVSTDTGSAGAAGPQYLVDSVDAWITEHADVVIVSEKSEIPGGSVVGFAAPGGHVFYVFDQPNA